MSQIQTVRRPLGPWRWYAVGTLLLAAAAVTFVWQAASQAGAASFGEKTYAAFPAADRMQVAVGLVGKGTGELNGTLQVDVLSPEGKVIKSASRAIQQEGALTYHSFEFPLAKAKAEGLKIRTLFLGKEQVRPLSSVLLAKGHETTLVSGKDFFTGSRSTLRCQVQAVRSLLETLPLPGAKVVVQLRAKDKLHTLYEGKTNSNGESVAQFQLPELPAGQYSLEVTTESAFGKETLKQDVKIRDDAKILLVTDKPVYQPGQLMHMRALVLRPFDLKPVDNAEINFEVEDGKGNKVFKKALTTSKFGVVSADFQLADEVNMGNYQIRATLGSYKADKTVQVKRYVLPKFKVEVVADKKFYMPKETIRGSLQSDYFFGKPVANSPVEIVASTFDVEFKKFQTWKGKTDANGHVKFEIQLPDYFVGQPLQKGNAMVKLDVKITDTADHAEKVTRTYTVSEQPIQVSLIPEGGKLAPDMKNRVFVAAIYPDGTPAVCDVSVWTGKEAKGDALASVKTNESGLAEFTLTPSGKQLRSGPQKQQQIEMLGGQQTYWGPTIVLDMTAQAKDSKGSSARSAIELNAHPMGENVLLHLNKAIYKSGESLKAEVLSSAGLPTAYIDIIRNGQVLLSNWMEVKDGKASYNLDVPQDVFGSLEVHAYQMLASGEIIRDTRVIYVQPATELKVQVQADKSVYAPGESGRISFLVTDGQGNPTAAALGVVVVDEAVYALQELHPGLEKIYFTLQEELLKPQVTTKYQPAEGVNNLVLQPAIPAAKQQVAQVLLANVAVKAPAQWQVNPARDRKQQVQNQLHNLGWALHNYAWHNDDAIVWNKKSEKWELNSNILDKAIKQYWGNNTPQWLKGPFGEKFSLADLQKLEKSFTADNLAAAITNQRLHNVSYWVHNYALNHKNECFKDGKWTLNQDILEKCVKQFNNDKRWLRDVWGNPLRLVHSKEKVKDQPWGNGSPMEHYQVVSAGPDGKIGTKDDITWMNNPYGYYGGNWWYRGLAPQTAGKYAARPEMFWLERAAANKAMAGAPMGKDGAGFGGGFGGNGTGFPIPGAGPGGGPGDVLQLQDQSKGSSGGGAAPITKVREYFPETMLWQPSLITDENGKADLNINFADSITTWRLTASANSAKGGLGGNTAALKVFQEFFVDIDLPVSLTQNDEVAFPVAVYNYLSTPQKVKVELQKEGWFELLEGAPVRELDLKANEVTAISFRVKANKVGNQPVTVKAYGSKKSDAVKRIVEVVPNGERKEIALTDRLEGNVAHTIDIPANAIPDSYKVMVKIYPGIMSQVVEGLDGMLRMPGGCFEQTSSSAYPNVLIVDYIKKAKLARPEMLMKAESLLNGGYQRLLTFERPGGGFDWWGSGEPLIWLSAYGLNEFSDMSRVWPVDKGIITRTQNFLLNKMDKKDGTWSTVGATHGETIASMGNPKLLLTSYVVWSLLESGLAKEKVAQSVHYIRTHLGDAAGNAYILATAANALAAYDPKDDSTISTLQSLEKLRQDKNDWQAVCFPAKGSSLTYAHGDSVTVETTALTVLAMLKTGQFTNTINKSLTYLIKSKQAGGTWGTTSATILSIKALIGGLGGARQLDDVPFTIFINGKEAGQGKITNDNNDMLHAFDLKDLTKVGANQVEIKAKGKTSLMYQVVGRYYQPWSKEKQPETKPTFDVKVAYDRTNLSTHDLLRAKATLKYLGQAETNMVMLELGVAPGFVVDAGDFAEMADKKLVQKFSITPTKVILYLGKVMRPGEVREFNYTLKAKFPLRAKTPPTVAYEYYTPTAQGVAPPTELTVTTGKKE